MSSRQYSLLSLVVGNLACDASCPFCVARLTAPQGLSFDPPDVDWRNFRKALRIARDAGTSTVMLTGKGEPLLFESQISAYLEEMRRFLGADSFPCIELQTNGMRLLEKREHFDERLARWYELGLDTVAISVAHHEAERNREIFLHHRQRSYVDLPELIEFLHRPERRFKVRLCCTLIDGYVGDVASVASMIAFAARHDVEELTFRPVTAPEPGRDDAVTAWIRDRAPSQVQLQAILEYLLREGILLRRTHYGAIVSQVGKQSVCLSNALTHDAEGETVRQLIFYPNGNVAYDWRYEGALLLRGRYHDYAVGTSARRLKVV